MWDHFWGGQTEPFTPIGTVAESAAALFGIHPSQMANVSIRDFVNAFTPLEQIDALKMGLSEKASVAAQNSLAHKEGRFTRRKLAELDMKFVMQLALITRYSGSSKQIDEASVFKMADALLTEQLMGTGYGTALYLIASAIFCGVERSIGGSDQGVTGLAMLGESGDSEGGGEVDQG